MKKNPKVIFFQVNKTQDKFLKIAKIAKMHFDNKRPLLFITPNETVQKYVDDLLWSEPKFSFLPHISSDIPVDDLIVITKKMINPNESNYIFNLTTIPLLNMDFSIIYELDDHLDRKKALFSKNKFKTYREKGYLIESR